MTRALGVDLSHYVLPYKTSVIIYESKNGWYKISNTKEEWCYYQYITIN